MREKDQTPWQVAIEYIRVRKRYWLAPIILFLMMIGTVIIFAESSAVTAFIYTLF